ncbi:MAG: glycosyltransferase family 2 protein [Proteobacteria bacterium]|nr:glycosyltransferase family 2 protein [Pseudomonadota bacterium]
MPPKLSVVVPFYNEGSGVDSLMERLVPVLDRAGERWEIVCVNDGSVDDTLPRLAAWHAKEPRIKALDLSRNFGKEAALSAGLLHAAGMAVVLIDGDLQHPPEVIPELVAKWREGYEMVYAVRRTRRDQAWSNRIATGVYYRMFRHFSEVTLPKDAGDFRLLDRKVVDALNRMPERNRFMKGLFAWMGFRQAAVPFDVGPRDQGRSKWGFVRLIRLGLAGLTAFSNFPLQVWSLIGAAISAIAFVYIVFRLLRSLVHGIDVPGYESIIISILFLGGIQLLSLGIIGDYLGRVFNEVKGRPLFIVRESYGIDLPGTTPLGPKTPGGAEDATR